MNQSMCQTDVLCVGGGIGQCCSLRGWIAGENAAKLAAEKKTTDP
jgi:hypothetical protein